MSSKTFRGFYAENESLSRYTTWKVGGPADRLYQPADEEDLCLFLSQLPKEEPLTWLGAGSKVLVRDRGIRGTVIVTAGTLQAIRMIRQDGQLLIRAEVGVPSARLAYFTVGLGLTGLEFLAGIPGLIGGALAMNAGAFKAETWRSIVKVQTVDRSGQLHLRPATDFSVHYRTVQGKAEEWFVAGYFALQPGDQEQSLQRIDDMLAKRRAGHPLRFPNAGSVFRNPEGHPAGQLIESCGLKGYRIGGAAVSNQHANFIANEGSATADDIERLIEFVVTSVEQKTQIHLEKEALILGEK